MIRGQSTDPPERERATRQYRAVREELVATEPRDVAHQLPNLVDTVGRVSREADTRRFLIGVSFSRDHAPLDYQLDRIVGGGEDPRRECLKEPVSGDHRYLRFPYPPDPGFDAPALRGALLAALERELRVEDGSSALGTRGNGSSGTLSARLVERVAALL